MKLLITSEKAIPKSFDILRFEHYLKESAQLLMPEYILNDLDINVLFVDKLLFDACVEVDDIDVGEEHPRSFNILVDRKMLKGDFESVLIAMCHEMVHVKQFALNELFDLSAGQKVLWCGEKYTQSGSIADYYNSPWEIEAYGKEKGLFYRIEEAEKLDKMILDAIATLAI